VALIRSLSDSLLTVVLYGFFGRKRLSMATFIGMEHILKLLL
jgi:hypothetical protein